ncbi:amidohydrolase family protein [Bacillus aerolatus]|uniref:Amidohydrolase family protein n=1 Tax=Bacillus aerolatus TaxID=2653354 RepID=A0A6I1FGQ5_9BACI|nr:amidohydrolase [Bacillus aerolatus]KAB7707365.1 amidohydrolase family protein [Bacillus aerolatus]
MMLKKIHLSTKKILILALVIALCMGFSSSGTLPKKLDPLAPDTVYVNGKIITMDADSSSAEAVAVKEGKIIAVGKSKDIRQLAGRSTKTVDLKGKVMLPGLIDAHSHFPSSGLVGAVYVDLNSPPVGSIEKIQDIIDVLTERSQKTTEGEWILGRGYDQTLIKEKRHPTRDDLDQVSTKHPIFLTHTSGHLAVANSAALKLAGITKDTPNPDGGTIWKDRETGEPTGVLEEGAMTLVSKHVPPASFEQNVEAVKEAVKQYTAAGVTTSIIASGSKESLINLQKYSKQGILPLRITTMGTGGGLGDVSASPGEVGGFITGFGNDMLKLGAVKMWQDGSIQGYTGYLSKPYHVPPGDDPDYRGHPLQSREKLAERVTELHKNGYQVAIHGNGDAAIDDILYAFRKAQEAFPRKDARHRIEHAQMAREDQLDEMKELGITPSFYVSHTFFWGDQHWETFMGPERAARMSPLNSAVKRGIRFSIHLDTPVTPMSPLQGVWSAVNRTARSGEVIGPEQRVTRMEALRAVTIDAAWQNFEENIKGSIEQGKYADFVILEENPLTVDPMKIKDINILETIINGDTVYKK